MLYEGDVRDFASGLFSTRNHGRISADDALPVGVTAWVSGTGDIHARLDFAIAGDGAAAAAT